MGVGRRASVSLLLSTSQLSRALRRSSGSTTARRDPNGPDPNAYHHARSATVHVELFLAVPTPDDGLLAASPCGPQLAPDGPLSGLWGFLGLLALALLAQPQYGHSIMLIGLSPSPANKNSPATKLNYSPPQPTTVRWDSFFRAERQRLLSVFSSQLTAINWDSFFRAGP